MSQPNSMQFQRSLTLLDGSMLVAGSMIGSGIFIVSADIARNVGSAGYLVLVWLIAGAMTVIGALSYAELSAMFPRAGGQYVYLREAWGKLPAFLYGWSFFAVIQTGSIAAVGVAFAKFAAYLIPALSDKNIALTLGGYQLNTAQMVAIALIVLLTFINSLGVRHGKIIQTTFTLAKIASLAALVVFGLWLGTRADVWNANWAQAWQGPVAMTSGSTIALALLPALAVSMVGALFSSDSWNSVTFIAGEIQNPKRNVGLSLFLGTTVVCALYVLANLMYLAVLPMASLAQAEADRVGVAAAQAAFGPVGTALIAALIMVSTFGCVNGLVLAGARVYYTMAGDGLFFTRASALNANAVPGWGLWLQCLWACVLCLTGRYGALLDYVIFVVLLFYILTIAGLFALRRTRPDAERPYRAFGYPLLPAIYLILATTICVELLIWKPGYTWPGLGIVLAGVPIYLALSRRNALATEV